MAGPEPGGGADAPGSESEALDALVRAHYAALCDFVYRYVSSRAVAEDVVQEVFVRIWERGDRFDYRDPLPYLYRAARNGALSHLRRERVRGRWRAQALLTAESEGETSAPPADAQVLHHELEEAINRAVDALPTRCRLIFTMSREQGLSYAEIAHALGLSVKTVEVQMGRALKALRTHLAPFLSVGFALLSASGLSDRLWP